jgi:hypothetical protein
MAEQWDLLFAFSCSPFLCLKLGSIQGLVEAPFQMDEMQADELLLPFKERAAEAEHVCHQRS